MTLSLHEMSVHGMSGDEMCLDEIYADKISVDAVSVDKMTCCLFPIEFNEGAETLIIQEKVIWDEMIEGIKSYLAIFSIKDCKFFSIDIYINSSLMSD
jgi:hypothetical protein